MLHKERGAGTKERSAAGTSEERSVHDLCSREETVDIVDDNVVIVLVWQSGL